LFRKVLVGLTCRQYAACAEAEAVAKILGKERPLEKRIIIYLPEVRELRRKLPTTTQYAFMVNLRDNIKEG